MHNFMDDMKYFSIGEKYLVFKHLQSELRQNQKHLMKLFEEANDSEKVKHLLYSKKESAIDEAMTLLPFLKPDNKDVKIIFLRILPVFFSYVTLYELKTAETINMLNTLRIHEGFSDCLGIFEQWFELFDRRKVSKKRFAYKDETCTRGLSILEANSNYSEFIDCIGYSNVALLRTFHRWLRLHRLHKYLYFFANLSYEEIIFLNEENLHFYEEKMGILHITIGAKHKILREVELLRQRRENLVQLLQKDLMEPQEIEEAIKIVKKIMRTPIAVNDTLQENIPGLLVAAMSKVFDAVINKAGVSENIIPVYGLFISVLKEAWNYNIFSSADKELFNTWRQQLSDNLNMNCRDIQFGFPSVAARPPLHVPIMQDYLSGNQHVAQNNITFGPEFYQCLEDISRNTAEYALN